MRLSLLATLMLLTVSLLFSSCKDSPTSTETEEERREEEVIAIKAIELSGTITSDSTLVNIFTEPESPDYIVTGTLNLDAKLTIMPGVRIIFKENQGLNINSDGVLVAEGKADSLIVFTGENQSRKGTWAGINIFSNSVDNSISNAEITYAGSKSAASYFDKAAITIDRAKINMSETLISHSGGYGIQTRRENSEFPMSDMRFEENEKDHATIHTSQIQYFDTASIFDGGYVNIYGGDSDSDMDISVLDGASYKGSGDITFKNDITIDAGTVFEFTTDQGLTIDTDASIIAKGTSEKKIVFTGTSKLPGAWRGIFVKSNSVDNIFEHVDISYGGSKNMASYFKKANLAIDHARIELKNVLFKGSAGYGLETRRTSSIFSVENSEFLENESSDIRIHPTQIRYIDTLTDFNGGTVEVYSGDTDKTGSETWNKLNNGTYHFSSSVTIKNEVTIEKGAKFEMGTNVVLTVYGSTSESGTIKAIGSPEELIIFTGRTLGKGAWGGIAVSSNSIENIMEHVKIEYGGGSSLASYLGYANLGVNKGARLTLKNSFIENSSAYGINIRDNGELNDEYVTFSMNEKDDINFF